MLFNHNQLASTDTIQTNDIRTLDNGTVDQTYYINSSFINDLNSQLDVQLLINLRERLLDQRVSNTNVLLKLCTQILEDQPLSGELLLWHNLTEAERLELITLENVHRFNPDPDIAISELKHRINTIAYGLRLNGVLVTVIYIYPMHGLPDTIEEILNADQNTWSRDKINTAVPYALSAHPGLSGIKFDQKSSGGQAVFRAIEYLTKQDGKTLFPHIQHVTTLTPLFGFKKYLLNILRDNRSYYIMNKEKLLAMFAAKEGEIQDEYYADGIIHMTSPSFEEMFIALIESGSWIEDVELRESLSVPFTTLATIFANEERHRNTGKLVCKPIAFHRGNGALLKQVGNEGLRVLAQANTTTSSAEDSLGYMVNMDYALGEEQLKQYRDEYQQSIEKILSEVQRN